MRLLKLSLESWRGIDSRTIQLSDGITLIEGPNEIGKSTIVEAVRMLFSEMDSSKKKNVKAVQPVGQDVGSSVQAEVTAGNYHFVYGKTYNKAPQTSLDIMTPTNRQLTGREAHEEVERILNETVDLALWDALLVEQGEKVALADFQNSAGLAKALDEAAGTSSAGGEDTGLYQVIQAEYEKYFTLRSGRSKVAGVEDAYKKAKLSLEDSKQALFKIEEDSKAHDRCADEVRRLTSLLPDLKTKMEDHEKSWTSIKSLKEQVEAKERELSSARVIQKVAADLYSERLSLIGEIKQNEKDLSSTRENIKPLQAKAKELKSQLKKFNLAMAELKKEIKLARAALSLAQDDEKQIHNLAALAESKNSLKQLDNISKSLKAELKTTGAITIDDTVLQELRQAERQQVLTGGKRDSAATTVSITAEKKLDLELDNEAIQLKATDIEKRSIASDMLIRIPGVASFQLSPPPSVAQLQEEADDAKAAFAKLRIRFRIKDLKEAESLNAQRIASQQEIDRLKELERTILENTSREEIEQAITSLQNDYDAYIQQRDSAQKFPESAGGASISVAGFRKELDGKEASLEEKQETLEALQTQHEEVDNQLRTAQQDLAGTEAALEVKQDRLDKARATEADKTLAKRAVEIGAKADKLEQEGNDLQASLSKSSPDSIEELLDNAKQVHKRAHSDLILEEQNLAVLDDRLQQAQADGRYETKEAAEREFEERETTLEATQRRATAAELLWKTLNKHRDAARQAYVRPLKEAIERLGAIVFGGGFEVELGEDWSVLSRTLHGKTLPFDALSVGAKEQLGILTRLAAGQIVSKQGGVPLIIDDALGFSDPARLETMGAAIAAAGKQCQIIILTCTPGRFTHVGSAEVVRF